MALLTIDEFRESLRCPRCGGKLTGPAQALTCQSPDCAHPYTGVSGKPVLVDARDSIIDVAAVRASSGASVLARQKGSLHDWVARHTVAAPNRTAQRVVARLADEAVAESRRRPRVLVVGGGAVGNGIEGLYGDSRVDLIAFDIYDSPQVQFLADAHRVPLEDASVDAVIIQAVLEHVLEPARVVAELHRVLRPGGLVYADTPFMQQVHEAAYDFTRFTLSGHRYLFRGFAERESGVVAGLGTALLWSIRAFAKGLPGGSLADKAFTLAFAWLPLLDRRLSPAASVDGASSVYFYGSAADRPVSPAEMVGYYSGRG